MTTPIAELDTAFVPDWLEKHLANMTRAEDFAFEIGYELQETVKNIISVGRLLRRAKTQLGRGEWGRLFAEKMVPFTISTAQRLMKIAAHPELSNPAHVQYLPSSWWTLYELTKVEPETLSAAFNAKLISPTMERQHVKALLPAPVSTRKGFDQVIAVERLRSAIERSIQSWPLESRHLVAQALRGLAKLLDTIEQVLPKRNRVLVAHLREQISHVLIAHEECAYQLGKAVGKRESRAARNQ
jgi:hypothetical protein